MQRKIFLICLTLSILIHISALVGLYWLKPQPEHENNSVEVTILSPPKIQPREPRIKLQAKQIVDQQKPSHQKIPVKTKYLSQFNQSVTHQTKATNFGAFRNRKKPEVKSIWPNHVGTAPYTQSAAWGDYPNLKHYFHPTIGSKRPTKRISAKPAKRTIMSKTRTQVHKLC